MCAYYSCVKICFSVDRWHSCVLAVYSALYEVMFAHACVCVCGSLAMPLVCNRHVDSSSLHICLVVEKHYSADVHHFNPQQPHPLPALPSQSHTCTHKHTQEEVVSTEFEDTDTPWGNFLCLNEYKNLLCFYYVIILCVRALGPKGKVRIVSKVKHKVNTKSVSNLFSVTTTDLQN